MFRDQGDTTDRPINLSEELPIPAHDNDTVLTEGQGSTTHRVETARLQKIMGRHMRDARELCELTIEDAAKRLEVEFKALRDAEMGRGEVPNWLLVRAASVYAVNAEWILGITTNFDPADQKHDRTFAELNYQLRIRAEAGFADSLAESKILKEIERSREAFRVVIPPLSDLAAAWFKFTKANPCWQDLPGLSPLAHVVSLLVEAKFDVIRADRKFQLTHGPKLVEPEIRAKFLDGDRVPVPTPPPTANECAAMDDSACSSLANAVCDAIDRAAACLTQEGLIRESARIAEGQGCEFRVSAVQSVLSAALKSFEAYANIDRKSSPDAR